MIEEQLKTIVKAQYAEQAKQQIMAVMTTPTEEELFCNDFRIYESAYR